jgi:DNA-binding LacI/PurR family transcriptional regulator
VTTIKDIARFSGVSYPTVSHVLNRTRKVSLKTQKKVFDAIDQLGYVPNAVARGLSKRRMNTIAVVASGRLSTLSLDHCHGPMIEAALIAAQEYDQVAMLYFAQTFPENVDRLSAYCDGRSDGLLLIGQPTNTEFVDALKRRSFPFVCVTEAELDCSVPYVDTDQVNMAETLAVHLLLLGHKKFVVLCGPESQINVHQRKIGFKNAFKRFKIPEHDAVFLPGEYTAESAEENLKAYLSANDPVTWPTAVLCMSDIIGFGALAALKEIGLNCPNDVSVAGIDNHRDSIHVEPPLTTMRMPLQEIGHQAVRMLMQIINKEPDVITSVNIASELITRSSTAPPPRRI